MPVQGTDILLVAIAIIFPPAAALFIAGCGCDLLINILLTCLGYFPGLLHAFWLVYKKMKAEETYGIGGYRYVGNGGFQPTYAPPAGGQAPPNYGGTS